MNDVVEYASPASGSRRSTLAVLALGAPFLALAIGFCIVSIAESGGTGTMPPWQMEDIELAGMLVPQLAAMAIGFAALRRIGKNPGKLHGKGWAIAGIIVCTLMMIYCFAAIVASHSWLD